MDNQTPIKELWLHHLWKSKRLINRKWISTKGQEIKIISPGWYNRGWGPDFKDARLMLDQDEFFGDIEIHINESDWQHHGHHKDETYNKVILHVYLNQAKTSAQNQFHQPLASLYLNADQQQSALLDGYLKSPESIDEIPGACGLSLTKENVYKLKQFLLQAAEQRLLAKSVSIKQKLIDSDLNHQENHLYTEICRSLGHSAYSEMTVKLALQYPYANLKRQLTKPHRQKRIEILSRWLGSAGLLESTDKDSVHDDLRREWLAFLQFWRNLPNSSLNHGASPKHSSRPLNHPLRRLTGLFYHLEQTSFHGLFKSWLNFFMESDQLIKTGKSPQEQLLSLLDGMFPQPEWEPLSHLIKADSHKPIDNPIRLIGKQRQLIVLVNAIIPFFLAWARLMNRHDIEKILFALILVLPPEGKNKKTNFMENRLAITHNEIKKSLSYVQGLIQLHEDCCRCFYQGCNNCSLLKLLG